MRQRGSRTISDVDGTRALPSVAEFEVSVAAYPGVPGGLSGGEECSRRPPQPEARDRCGRLVQHAVPLNTVRDLLGHSSVGMSLRYAHLAPDQRREAVAKLNEKPLLALTLRLQWEGFPAAPMAALSTANNSIATWRAASLP